MPSSERGRWNAAESISSMSWSGSAVIGGGAWGWMVLGSGEFKLMISLPMVSMIFKKFELRFC